MCIQQRNHVHIKGATFPSGIGPKSLMKSFKTLRRSNMSIPNSSHFSSIGKASINGAALNDQ